MSGPAWAEGIPLQWGGDQARVRIWGLAKKRRRAKGWTFAGRGRDGEVCALYMCVLLKACQETMSATSIDKQHYSTNLGILMNITALQRWFVGSALALPYKIRNRPQLN
jgi:hypothetical protein